MTHFSLSRRRRRTPGSPPTHHLCRSPFALALPRTRLGPSAPCATLPNTACGVVSQVDALSPRTTANDHINVLSTGPIETRYASHPLDVWRSPCGPFLSLTMITRSHAHTVLNACVYCLQLRASIIHSGLAHNATETAGIYYSSIFKAAKPQAARIPLGRLLRRSRSDACSDALARILAQTLSLGHLLRRSRSDACSDALTRTLAQTLSLGHLLRRSHSDACSDALAWTLALQLSRFNARASTLALPRSCSAALAHLFM